MKKIIYWLAFRSLKTHYNFESQKDMGEYKYAWQKGWNDCISEIRRNIL